VKSREGCCETWPKPCTYHEGYLDGQDDASFESYLTHTVALCQWYKSALERIANVDYRGNRSHESEMAYAALVEKEPNWGREKASPKAG
jgi:hypothetical protein